MELSLYQTGALLFLFFLILIWIWHRNDQKQKEPLFLLCAFFIISGLASFAFYQWEIYSRETSGWISMFASSNILFFGFLEELLKAAVLIFVLELAQSKFNEISDGLIYGAVVAMGFVFVENLVYSQSSAGVSQGMIIFLRSLITNALHMITTMYFGYFYANAYLNRNHKLFDMKKMNKPYAIFRHFGSYIRRYIPRMGYLALPFALMRIVTLHITRTHIMMQVQEKNKPHRPGEFILEGFLGALYLHWLYNYGATLPSGFLQMFFLIAPLVIFILVFWKFNRINRLRA